MSDLIERLEAFQEKSETYAGCDENDEIWQDCGKYVLENLPAFLSSLKTVRGIEGLYKLGRQLRDVRSQKRRFQRTAELLHRCDN